MRFESQMTHADYLVAMKEQMESFTDFGLERFTGIIIGRFFSITYHSGHEFNRRITNEKHRAIGFVRPSGNGIKVRCIRLAGMTNPISLIIIYCLCLFFSVLKTDLDTALMPQYLLTYAILTLIVALITAVTDSVTERGREGARILSAFLLDPLNFYSNLY